MCVCVCVCFYTHTLGAADLLPGEAAGTGRVFEYGKYDKEQIENKSTFK